MNFQPSRISNKWIDRMIILNFIIVIGFASLSHVCHAADKILLAYAFAIAEESSRESQEYHFSDRLVYNYTPNPALRFLEGKKFEKGEIASFVKSMLVESRLQRVPRLRVISVADHLWINTEASAVMAGAARDEIDILLFFKIKSIALVQAINQGKTLFRYNRDKPDETVTYDYFYNILGDVALIDVKKNSVIYRNSLNGLDFQPPHQKTKENVQQLLYRTALELGDLLHDVIKNNRDLVQQASLPPHEN